MGSGQPEKNDFIDSCPLDIYCKSFHGLPLSMTRTRFKFTIKCFQVPGTTGSYVEVRCIHVYSSTPHLLAAGFNHYESFENLPYVVASSYAT